MLTNAHKMLTRTHVVPTQNVSITKVHITANAYHLAEGVCVDDDECSNNNNDCHESRSVCTNAAKTYTMEWVSGVATYTMSRRGFVPVLPVTPITMKMVPSVPMLINASLTMTICAKPMLTALTLLVVTNVHAKLHIGKAKAWTAMMVAQDVLTSTNVPPEPIMASPSMVLTKTVMRH